jgi:predicted Holliday junction resolvase-like endonuclease
MSDLFLLIILSLVILVLGTLYYNSALRLKKILSEKQSLSVKYGKMTEQFFPFMKDYRYNPGNFRFLGTPVDGIQFEDDKIIFIEFKSGNSTLSERQKRIRELVEKKKVEFEEMNIR